MSRCDYCVRVEVCVSLIRGRSSRGKKGKNHNFFSRNRCFTVTVLGLHFHVSFRRLCLSVISFLFYFFLLSYFRLEFACRSQIIIALCERACLFGF